jgi:hypothetical protein
MRLAPSVLIAALCMTPARARADAPARVVAVAWPTRAVDWVAHQARVLRAATRVAQRLAAPAPTDPKASVIDLSGRFARAQAALVAGRLDEAARLFDAAIEDAARAPHRLGNGGELITAYVARASIGLARGEQARAKDLLARALRYDPGLTLTVTEESPALASALEEARQRAAAPAPIAPADLAPVCRDSGTFVIGRALGVDSIEWSRWDGCRQVSSIALPAGTPDEEVSSAIIDPASHSAAIARKAEPSRTRKRWPIGAGIGAAGLVLTISGGVLVGLAANKYDQLLTTCGVDATCRSSYTSDWDAREKAGWALLGIGSAALVGGIVWAIIDAKRHARF